MWGSGLKKGAEFGNPKIYEHYHSHMRIRGPQCAGLGFKALGLRFGAEDDCFRVSRVGLLSFSCLYLLPGLRMSPELYAHIRI